MPKKSSHQVRIIGGKWRGRKIPFPELVEIRPTPSRVRETLFNWLNPYIQDANCLDMFAGSGALGFEALSRGAKHVVMVDKSPVVIEQLRASAQMLQANEITLYQGHAPENLIVPKEPFDIVFLDPPFHRDLIKPSCAWLIEHALITPNSWVYIEAQKRKGDHALPENCHVIKQGQTQYVSYYLTQFDVGGSNPISNDKS